MGPKVRILIKRPQSNKQTQHKQRKVKEMTPYAAAKFVNEELKKAGIEKPIPTQMMYNYTSARMNAGKKPFIEYTIEEGINEDSLKNWTTK